MCYVSSAMLSRSKIRDVVKRLGKDAEKVIANYFEYIPQGNFTVEDKIGFIVSAIPSAGAFSAPVIAEQLRRGPIAHNPVGAPATKPVIYAKWSVEYPEQVREVAEFYKQHKHVPDDIRSNQEWCCLCALAEMIDWGLSNGMWPGIGAPTTEQVHDIAAKWLCEMRKGFERR